MSITDYRAAQREDRAAERAQDREDQRLAHQAQLDAARLAQESEDRRREQERLDREQQAREKADREERDRQAKAAAEKEAKKEKAKRQKERRERRTAALRAVPGWVGQHLDLAAALTVMACSIVPALISQAAALGDTGLGDSGVGVLMVALLPVMLECAAWAATAAETKAMKAAHSPWPYRIAIYVFASLAAAVNFAHGQDVGGVEHGTQLGAVLAASSVIPIAIWQLVQMGRHRHLAEQRKAARKAKRDHEAWKKQCKELYPDVWHTARQLRAIAGPGKLTKVEAFSAAYAVHEGAGDGDLDADLMVLLSADLLELRVDAEERLADVLGLLEAARSRRRAASTGLTGNGSPVTPEASADASVKTSANGVTTPPTQSAGTSASGLLDHLGRPLPSGSSPQVAPSLPPSARARAQTPARTRSPRPAPPARTLSNGAKTAAKETAKRSATPAAADEKRALEEWALDRLRTSGQVSWQDIRDEALARRKKTNKKATPPARSWAYDRRAAAIAAHGKGGLHAVRSEVA